MEISVNLSSIIQYNLNNGVVRLLRKKTSDLFSSLRRKNLIENQNTSTGIVLHKYNPPLNPQALRTTINLQHHQTMVNNKKTEATVIYRDLNKTEDVKHIHKAIVERTELDHKTVKHTLHHNTKLENKEVKFDIKADEKRDVKHDIKRDVKHDNPETNRDSAKSDKSNHSDFFKKSFKSPIDRTKSTDKNELHKPTALIKIVSNQGPSAATSDLKNQSVSKSDKSISEKSSKTAKKKDEVVETKKLTQLTETNNGVNYPSTKVTKSGNAVDQDVIIRHFDENICELCKGYIQTSSDPKYRNTTHSCKCDSQDITKNVWHRMSLEILNDATFKRKVGRMSEFFSGPTKHRPTVSDLDKPRLTKEERKKMKKLKRKSRIRSIVKTQNPMLLFSLFSIGSDESPVTSQLTNN